MKLSSLKGIVVALAVVALCFAAVDKLTPAKFSPEGWIQADPATNDRVEMFEDLERNRELIGSTRAEIESLLGPGREKHLFGDWDIVYKLGRAGIDHEWLVFKFDDLGRTIAYDRLYD